MADLAPVPTVSAVVDLTRSLSLSWFSWLNALLQRVNQRDAPSTFATLPASPVVGMHVAITDSSTAVWGATIAGGGANTVLAFYNGTNWTVAAK